MTRVEDEESLRRMQAVVDLSTHAPNGQAEAADEQFEDRLFPGTERRKLLQAEEDYLAGFGLGVYPIAQGPKGTVIVSYRPQHIQSKEMLRDAIGMWGRDMSTNPNVAHYVLPAETRPFLLSPQRYIKTLPTMRSRIDSVLIGLILGHREHCRSFLFDDQESAARIIRIYNTVYAHQKLGYTTPRFREGTTKYDLRINHPDQLFTVVGKTSSFALLPDRVQSRFRALAARAPRR